MLIATTFAIGLIGFVCAVSLATAAGLMSVQEDPRLAEIEEVLPGANCGGCGFAGCAEYAKAILIDGAAINLCAPGGQSTLDALSAMMGAAAGTRNRQVALVLCGGDHK